MTGLIQPLDLAGLDLLTGALKQRGYAVLSPELVAQGIGCQPAELMGLNRCWDDLATDTYLKDGGRYRKRRHSCFVVDAGHVQLTPHRAHWQPVEYNALHGGMQRWFEPMTPEVVNTPLWRQLLVWLARVCSACTAGDAARHGSNPWFVEAHQFRIDTTDGIGRPTPEGAHRDGVDFVAVFMVGRVNIKGGETRVFDAQGPSGERFTLSAPWSLLLLDDAKVIHESTPIQPVVPGAETGSDAGPGAGSGAYRDTLVVTLRRGGFQGA
jgi:hypothetical protein